MGQTTALVFVSIVFAFVRICPRHPEQGNAPSGRAFDLIGISPLRGSLRAALLSCDGFITLDFRTERKYHYCFCLSWPSVRMRRTVRLIGRVAYQLSDGRRKVKDALYYSVVKEQAEAIEKAPSLSMPKR